MMYQSDWRPSERLQRLAERQGKRLPPNPPTHESPDLGDMSNRRRLTYFLLRSYPENMDRDIARVSESAGLWWSLLDDRQRIVIEHRYELNGKPFIIFRELGEMLGVSLGRVRQIESQAWRIFRWRIRRVYGWDD